MTQEFDLSKYQTVKQRKDLFADDHKTGVILALPMKADGEEARFTAAAWTSRAAYTKGLHALQAVLLSGTQISDLQALLVMGPHGIGTAYEAKWMGEVDATSWTENAEESAIGRCLDNIGYHGNGTCSREEIEKVQRTQAASRPSTRKAIESEASSLFVDGLELPEDYPEIKRLVEIHKGKNGINDLKAVVSEAKGRKWSEERLLKWVAEQGIDLENGAKTSDFAKLLFTIKQEG